MNVQATSIINALFNPEEIVNLRVFADKKDDTFKGLKEIISSAAVNFMSFAWRYRKKLSYTKVMHFW